MAYTQDDLQRLLKKHDEIITYNIDQNGNLSMVPSWSVGARHRQELTEAFFDTLYDQAKDHGYKEREIKEGSFFDALKNRKRK